MSEVAIQSLMTELARLKIEVARLKTLGTTAPTGGAIGIHGNEAHEPDFATEADLATTNENLSAHTEDTDNPHETSFLILTDTPDVYTGAAGKFARVKSDLSGVEFADVPSSLTVRDIDGTPDVIGVSTIRVTNGKLSDNGSGTVTLDLTGATITVEEQDGSPSVSGVTKIKVTNGTLTNDGGGTVSLNLAGSGSTLVVKEIDGTPTVANVATIQVTNGKLTDNGSGDVTIDLTGTALAVQEQDGTPNVSNVIRLKFSNGTVTDDGGGVVSINTTGVGIVVKEADGTPNVSGVTELRFSNGTVTDEGSGAVTINTTGVGLTVKESDGTPNVVGVSEIRVTNGKLTDNGSGAVSLDLTGTQFNLTVREQDTSPNLTGISTIEVTNGRLSSGGAGIAVLDLSSTPTLTVEEIDGAPSVTSVAKIKFNNGTVTDNGGGTVTVNVGGSSSLTVEEIDGSPSVAAVSTIKVTNGKLTDNGGGTITLDLSGGAGSGGDSTTTGTLSGRPSPSNNGDLYFPSDGLAIHRDTGAAYATWGPIHPLTKPPALASWTWYNQETGTASEDNEGIYLEAPAAAGNDWRILAMSAPSTPYTITAMLIPNWLPVTGNQIGFGWRQSSDGKLALLTYTNIANIASAKWTSETAISANYRNVSSIPMMPLIWRMTDDGTDRKLSFSRDGKHFFEFHSVGRTDFLTGDQVCFACMSNDPTNLAGVHLVSWKQT